MNKKEQGFSLIEVLLVAVVLGILGVVGWLVYGKQEAKSPVQSAAATDTSKTEAAKPAMERYENKQYGFTLEYPAGWKAQTASADAPLTVYITSPDLKIQEGGYGGATEGATIRVTAGSISSGKLAYYSAQSILANTAKSKSIFTEQKEVKVDGASAVEYKAAYEGPVALTTQIDKGDITYSIILEQDIDGPTFNGYMQEYKNLVNSFKFTN
jgi:prepilin-type N-terminal cleavage/methylation domain-containing protein